jgi:hypothetical protein
MLIDINFGVNAEYTITYELFDNRVARRIWERFNTIEFEPISRTQFYNFGESIDEVKAKLNQTVEDINRLLPGQFKGYYDLNMLHTNFPDLVKGTHGELRQVLSMFNYHLHHLEDLETAKSQRIIIANQDPGEQLQNSDYELFTIAKRTNWLYMNYPHVGKHLLEVCEDNDFDIPKNHIVPTSLLKNDLLCWFADDRYNNGTKQSLNKVKRKLTKIINKLPYDINDDRLALGHIPIGVAKSEVNLEIIKQHKYFHSIQVQ